MNEQVNIFNITENLTAGILWDEWQEPWALAVENASNVIELSDSNYYRKYFDKRFPDHTRYFTTIWKMMVQFPVFALAVDALHPQLIKFYKYNLPDPPGSKSKLIVNLINERFELIWTPKTAKQ